LATAFDAGAFLESAEGEPPDRSRQASAAASNLCDEVPMRFVLGEGCVAKPNRGNGDHA
jgi:hypothetical protein